MVPSGNTVPFVLVPDLANNPDHKFWSAGQVCTRVENAPPGVEVYVWVQSVDLVVGRAMVNISSTYPSPLTRHRIVAIRKKRGRVRLTSATSGISTALVPWAPL